MLEWGGPGLTAADDRTKGFWRFDVPARLAGYHVLTQASQCGASALSA